MKRYVDVILPLPLEGFFTYAVPERLAEKVKRGVRVLVPLGKSKRYVGLAVEVHDRKPDFAQIKEVMEVLDAEPVVREEQFRLWQWIADYYLSPIGEVYNAAFPLGMKTVEGYKPKLETYVALGEKYRNEQALHIALDVLARAPKQQKVFIDYLQLSRWDSLEECGVRSEECGVNSE